jgi:hypothetical protein|tara:strand:+ start:291 stop:584 length:294 start_codon:yes stop_codon:yes gene_type:complete
MKRYQNNKIKIDKDGKRVYSTTYYPPIPLSNTDEFIQTKDGSRLDTIAQQFYGDVSLWWIIAKANGIRGFTSLKSGIKLRIPSKVADIIESFKQLNN